MFNSTLFPENSCTYLKRDILRLLPTRARTIKYYNLILNINVDNKMYTMAKQCWIWPSYTFSRLQMLNSKDISMPYLYYMRHNAETCVLNLFHFHQQVKFYYTFDLILEMCNESIYHVKLKYISVIFFIIK